MLIKSDRLDPELRGIGSSELLRLQTEIGALSLAECSLSFLTPSPMSVFAV